MLLLPSTDHMNLFSTVFSLLIYLLMRFIPFILSVLSFSSCLNPFPVSIYMYLCIILYISPLLNLSRHGPLSPISPPSHLFPLHHLSLSLYLSPLFTFHLSSVCPSISLSVSLCLSLVVHLIIPSFHSATDSFPHSLTHSHSFLFNSPHIFRPLALSLSTSASCRRVCQSAPLSDSAYLIPCLSQASR